MKPGLPVITLTSSFCTMAYSMLMATVMMDFTGEEVLTQCLTMGPYLMGLGIGSSFGDHIREEKYLQFIWRFEWLSVIVLPLIPLLQLVLVFLFLNLSPVGVTLDSKSALQVLLLVNGFFAAISGVLGGAQLPLILKMKTNLKEEWILAINYLGPLLAGFAIVLMGASALPLGIQIYAIGLVQLAGLFVLTLEYPSRLKSLSLLAVPLLVLLLAAKIVPEIEMFAVKSGYLKTKSSFKEIATGGPIYNVLRKYATLERVRTPYQTIDLFIEPPLLEYSIPGNASLFLNRKPQFDLFSVPVYHETMVNAGLNLLGHAPKNILILGAGDGLLLNEFRKHPEVTKITMVELDEKMLEWSRSSPVLSQMNGRSLEKTIPGQEVIVGDGVSFLRHAEKEKYDLVLIDFPFPNGPDLAKLYSYEFYRLVERALSKDGLLVLDLPLYIDRERELANESLVIVKTMQAAGLVNPILFGPSASFIAVSKEGKKLTFDYDKFPRELSLAAVLNFATPFREHEIPKSRWEVIPLNTMFHPGGI